jgi:hypothetical protein
MCNCSLSTSLQIINAAGVVVYTQEITASDETLQLEHLSPGVYIFRFEKDGEVATVRVVKE